MIQMSPWPTWGPTLPLPQKSQLCVVSRATRAPRRGPGPGGGHTTPCSQAEAMQALWPYFLFLCPLPQPSGSSPCASWVGLAGREPVPKVHGRGCAIQDCTHPKRQVGGQDEPSVRWGLRSNVRMASPSSQEGMACQDCLPPHHGPRSAMASCLC